MPAINGDHAEEAIALRDGRTTEWDKGTLSLFEAGSSWDSVGEIAAEVQPSGKGSHGESRPVRKAPWEGAGLWRNTDAFLKRKFIIFISLFPS